MRLERGDQVLIAAIITVTRSMQGLRSHETYIGNQSEAVVSFDSWGFAHKAVVGLEFGRQTSFPLRSGRVMREALAALEALCAAPSQAVERSRPARISVVLDD